MDDFLDPPWAPRSAALLLADVLALVGWAVVALSPRSVYSLYAGRVLCGIATGALTVVGPVYLVRRPRAAGVATAAAAAAAATDRFSRRRPR